MLDKAKMDMSNSNWPVVRHIKNGKHKKTRHENSFSDTRNNLPITPHHSLPRSSPGRNIAEKITDNDIVVTAPAPLLPTPHEAAIRQSVASTTSISHDEFRFCRICHESDGSTADLDFDAYGQLIAPCLCDGTLKYVHEKCVQRWMEVSRSKSCELCRFEYEVLTFTKPMKEWKRCLFFAGVLCNLLIFDAIILLLVALLLWWCAVTATDSEIYRYISTMPYGASLLITTMVIPFTIFVLTFGLFSTNYCREFGHLWCRFNCVSVVSEPSEERVAKLRLQRQSQQLIEAHL